MFRRLKEFLAGTHGATSPEPSNEDIPATEEFSFESLWDDYERRTWHYDNAKATLGKSNPRLLNWIGSIDYSGYTREKSLRALIASAEPGDENRILLRLQDWVPQVQRLAGDWVLAHFRSLPFDSIRSNQRLILYLSRKDRLQNDPGLLEIKRDLLARTRGMTPAQFFGLEAMFRRFLFSLSFEDDGHLRPWILGDPEPFNRLLLLSEFQFSEITPDEKLRLQADKSVFVRRRLFQTQIDAGITPERDELISLALDPNRSFRERGQFYLKSIYGEDCYAIYHAKEGEEFYFIGDYARPEDAEHFLAGIRSGSRPTQQACMRALASAAPDRLNELDIASLISQNRRFRSILVPLLPQLLSIDGVLALRSAFERSSPFGTVSFLRVLEKKSFWTFVDEGLSLLISEPETALRQSIVRPIQSRVAIYESLPSPLRDSITKKIIRLRDHGQKQDQGVADLLEFTIRTA
ncbi:hypothetical protein HNR46_002066 [Haloferula luteola]|uniref:Uncharacterized protein n=1 Tax=Haloferula luteola TaxID=595692 RepID=A0A840V0D4_9BACT|nr:hypothetical protein [Haloferula luteola]MBB5351827.1 hypothetical protein [Haloferula luteola]